MRDDVYVYFVDFPDSVHSVCTVCADGYNIYINERLDDNHRQIAYLHELVHINNGHLERDINVDEIEGEVHGTANEL